MKKFFLFIGIMTALLTSCKKDILSKEPTQTHRDTTVTVSIISPTLNQNLKAKEIAITNWIGEEVAEESYEVWLHVKQNNTWHKYFLGTAKKTDPDFKWAVPSKINGITIDSDCCYISFEGTKNKSYFIGQLFSIRPVSGLIGYNRPLDSMGWFFITQNKVTLIL